MEGEEGIKDGVGGGGWGLRAGVGVGDRLLDEVHDAAGEGDSFSHAVFVLEAGESSLDFAGEVEGYAVGGLGLVEGAAACVELRADLLEGGFEGLGDEFFVEAARQGRHSCF